MGELIYRISSSKELEEYQKKGFLQGGDWDKSSGFIHLSKRSQVPIVLKMFMPNVTGLYLLAIDPIKLGEGLKNEKVEGMDSEVDAYFPHFYGPSGLPLEALVEIHKLDVVNGMHVLPF